MTTQSIGCPLREASRGLGICDSVLRAESEVRDVRQFIHVSGPCDHVVTKYLNGSESKEILPAAQQA